MRYYILETKAESDLCLQECLTASLQNVSDKDYKSQTTEWATEQQRITDNKYIVPVCPNLGTFGYAIETAQDDWFPTIEE
tara:strand:+ start:71 stop:310 length:240 start_codon:yes stop_codon:yes gene_type:complete